MHPCRSVRGLKHGWLECWRTVLIHLANFLKASNLNCVKFSKASNISSANNWLMSPVPWSRCVEHRRHSQHKGHDPWRGEVRTGAAIWWVFRVQTLPPDEIITRSEQWKVQFMQRDHPSVKISFHTWCFDSFIQAWKNSSVGLHDYMISSFQAHHVSINYSRRPLWLRMKWSHCVSISAHYKLQSDFINWLQTELLFHFR